MSIRLLPHRSLIRFLLPMAVFLFSSVAGISFAAWLDAPNAPPNYGITGCTPPCLQEDFKPMNLGATPQTKRGSIAVVGTILATPTDPATIPNYPGQVLARGFRDSENTNYFIEPGGLGYSGLFRGGVGIGTMYPGAKLTVTTLDTKLGSNLDTIYAYANSANAAISAEQANLTGYAIYASGGINYFGGTLRVGSAGSNKGIVINSNLTAPSGVIHFGDSTNHTYGIYQDGTLQNFFGGDVKVGTAATPKSLCLNDDCKTAWPSSGVWTTSGTNIYNNNSGNVGIGTATPGAKLDVAGNAHISGQLYGDGSGSNYGSLSINGSKNGWSGINFPGSGTLMMSPSYSGFYNAADNNWRWYVNNDGSVYNQGNLNFTSSNPYISASSYFIAPGGAYFNSGTVYAEAPIQARGGIHDDAHSNLTISGGTSGNTFFSGHTFFSGNVGIGTATPGAKLEVTGPSFLQYYMKAGDTGGRFLINNQGIVGIYPQGYDNLGATQKARAFNSALNVQSSIQIQPYGGSIITCDAERAGTLHNYNGNLYFCVFDSEGGYYNKAL